MRKGEASLELERGSNLREGGGSPTIALLRESLGAEGLVGTCPSPCFPEEEASCGSGNHGLRSVS